MDYDKIEKDTKAMQRVIEEVGFDFDWSEEKVWALKVPVVEMKIIELEWHLGMPFWNHDGVSYCLKPEQVLKEREKYRVEYERILKSDLKYPLDIMFWKGRWLLLDGLHRLAKAKLLGYDKVNVREIPQKDIPAIRQ
jgi:tRNA nucleotidyltransferase (CCA-adding enzyme)